MSVMLAAMWLRDTHTRTHTRNQTAYSYVWHACSYVAEGHNYSFGGQDVVEGAPLKQMPGV
jgi:hypothetical protein